MAKSILILDDDADFNHLLTDIFTQASYEVTSERDPETAIEIFKQKHFDIVVTDQKMPGLTGEEFIQEIRRVRTDIPVIMVSGYLNNDTIRNLIREGIGGVFLKPLNVFSLLKRTASLIAESELKQGTRAQTGEVEGNIENLTYQHQLPFQFKSFPCKSPKAIDFAKKLHSLRNFKTNLIIIGEPGTDFPGIVNDLKGFESEHDDAFIIVDSAQLNAAGLHQIIEDAETSGARRITLALPETQALNHEQKQLIFQLSKLEGPFKNFHSALRFIFYLNDDIDVLYESEALDDDIYMFMGTTEIKVPPLRDIRDDIPVLAYTWLVDEAKAKGVTPIPMFDTAAKVYLHERDWHNNAFELRQLIQYSLSEVDGKTLTRQQLETASNKISKANSAEGTNGFRLKLQHSRDEFTKAVYFLLGQDRAKTAQQLGVDEGLLKCVLKGH